MLYIPLKEVYVFDFKNVRLMNVYKSEEGKHNYYGVIQVSDVSITGVNEYIQNNKPPGELLELNNYLRFKFPTHYGRPVYKARKSNGMPTIAEVLCEELQHSEIQVDVKLKIEGYVKNLNELHVVVQCKELSKLA